MFISKKIILIVFFALMVILGLYFNLPFLKENLLVNRTNLQDLECKDCNLIIISLSNISAEHMSLYGYERLTSPNLDKWAKDAIVFKNAFTHASWTLPVAVSLFSSLYPYTHQVTDRYVNNILDKNIKTLPEILKDNGYKTAAFTGGLDYSSGFGHIRGFEEFKQPKNLNIWPTDIAGFSSSLEKASKWLNNNSGDKFFLFLHGYDAHCPFDPPKKFKGVFSNAEGKNITIDNTICLRGYKNSEDENYEAYYFKKGQQKVVLTQDDIDYLKDLYDEEILSVDEIVSNFLNNLDKKILDKTIIVIFSDHGEMFAKHGRFGRAGTTRGTLYDDVLHIPLIIKIPQKGSKTINGLVQIIDIMPTLLNSLDISINRKMQGKDLTSLVVNDKLINDYVFAGSKFGVGLRNLIYKIKSLNESIRNDKWKLIREVNFPNTEENNKKQIEEEFYELYDLENDPDELNNLINKEVKIANDLKEKLSKWVKESQEFLLTEPQTQELPEDFIEEAKKRGYW